MVNGESCKTSLKNDLMQTSDLINRAETIVENNQQRLIGFIFISETKALSSSARVLYNSVIFQ